MLRKLAGQTLIYGISSIAAKFLNYLLTPYLTRIMTTQEYGYITDIYALIPFVLIILTMGMESGYFKFAGAASDTSEKKRIFETTWGIISLVAVIFFGVTLLFLNPIAGVMEYQSSPEFVWLMGAIIMLDAFTAIPYAKLRQEGKATEYVIIRSMSIVINTILCVAFYSLRPFNLFPETTSPGYYLVANLVMNLCVVVMLYPAYKGYFPRIDKKILRTIFIYSMPLLISGIAGTANEFIDRQFIKYLIPGDSMSAMGIYGAVTKIAVIMTLFIQMYRMGAEPFFLSGFKKEDFDRTNAEAMKYFIIISVIIFLVITLFTDLFQIIVGENFREGMYILPIVLLANIGTGVILNLSFWYKQSGLTKFAILITGSGLVCTIILNFWLVPLLGYAGAAWARLCCEAVMVIISYILCQKYYPIHYDLRRIGEYLMLGAALYATGMWASALALPVQSIVNLLLITIFVLFAIKRERINIKSILRK